MKYFQTWQDFMRQPEMMQLKEQKGIHACKQRYIQEQNKMQWFDPAIIAENQSPGVSVASTANNAVGSSTNFITGHSAEVSTITWSANATNAFTASNAWGLNSGQNYIDLEARGTGSADKGTREDPHLDFAAGHSSTKYKFRMFLTTGSKGLLGATGLLPTGYHGILTGSTEANVGTAGMTGSVLHALKMAINSQAGGEVICGSTNGAIGTKRLFTATLNAGSSSLTVTNIYKGGVDSATAASNSTTSGSVAAATTTHGEDTFFYNEGEQTFDGELLPYSNMPRKSYQ
tara:strand:+ start:777 stop:1640 length:864 start_codon:yes stop_codon:yes gene_type:complete